MLILAVKELNLSDNLMVLRGLGFLWGAVVTLGLFDSLFDGIRHKAGRKRVLGNLAALLLAHLITIMANEGVLITYGPAVTAGTFALLLLLSIGIVFQVRYSVRRRKSRIYPGSVKESVDQLSTGVCYYYGDGRIKLHNASMEKIWNDLTGKSMVDGRELWETISQGRAQSGSCISKGEVPIYMLPDESVRSWRRNKVSTDGMELYEVLAADVTEEYALVHDLEEKKERLRHRGTRLKAVGERIDALNIEKEILDSKIRIHDDWGRALITAKAFIEQPDMEKKRGFLTLWERNISYVEENEQSEAKDAYDDIFQSAKSLGLTIDIDEELPSDYDTRNLLIHAMAVCIGNMVKHAEATTLHVKTVHKDGRCTYTFTNDGQPPANTVEEKGGLKNLRRRVEAQGGSMFIDSMPRFALHIELGEKQHDT
ncbi:MAG: hypothetical protein IKD90_13210 [Clostridiales bacterium]|nr:hypothetical protein [Clostridiales bacterium]